MKYEMLGNSDLKVSKACLGCMGFGEATKGMHSWTLPYEESKEIIAYALKQGINFFDTAMVYQGGSSEEFVGRAIKELAKREDVVIATKFPVRSEEEIKQGINGKQHVINCLDGSLKRLDMDYVDLFIYHQWDFNTPLEEILEGLNEVVKSGKVRYIGISNCTKEQLETANRLSKENNWPQFISVQNHYNLIFREEENEMTELCNKENIAMTPYSALAAGRLSKHPGEESKRMKEDKFAKGKYDKAVDNDLKIIKRVEELAAKRNVSMTEISLAWLYTKVTSPVIGATKVHHIDGAVNAADITLTKEEIDYLEEPYQHHEIVGVMASYK